MYKSIIKNANILNSFLTYFNMVISEFPTIHEQVSVFPCTKEGKDQELIQSRTTLDPGYQWESNKLTIRHHKREPRGTTM